MGALVLFNSSGTPDYFRVNVPLVIATSVVLAASFAALLIFAFRAQSHPAMGGVETLVGKAGEARSANSAQIAGELWTAEAESGSLAPGDKVVVIAVKGLKVIVQKQ